MVTIKTGVAHGRFFNLNGLDYPSQDYTLVYRDLELKHDDTLNYEVVRVGISYKYSPEKLLQSPLAYYDWHDKNGNAYESFQDLIKDLRRFLRV